MIANSQMVTSCSVQAQAEVQILAQGGSRPLEELSNHQHIKIHTIPDMYAMRLAIRQQKKLPMRACHKLCLLLAGLVGLPSGQAYCGFLSSSCCKPATSYGCCLWPCQHPAPSCCR